MPRLSWDMGDDPDHVRIQRYRVSALDAAEQAERSSDPASQRSWRSLVEAYLMMAQTLERQMSAESRR
jgi:hypothetical protein